ncbi:hypothetical protein EJB05_19384, partial [Eragrostis curvula]
MISQGRIVGIISAGVGQICVVDVVLAAKPAAIVQATDARRQIWRLPGRPPNCLRRLAVAPVPCSAHPPALGRRPRLHRTTSATPASVAPRHVRAPRPPQRRAASVRALLAPLRSAAPPRPCATVAAIALAFTSASTSAKDRFTSS